MTPTPYHRTIHRAFFAPPLSGMVLAYPEEARWQDRQVVVLTRYEADEMSKTGALVGWDPEA